VENWPVFGSALPDRFALIVGLAATGLLAMGLDWLLAADWKVALFLGLALAAACVVPLLPRPYPVTAAPAVPRFFADTRRWLPAGSTVLVLPYPTGTQTVPLAWQAGADMAFQMPGGYFIGPAAGGEAYIGGPGPLPVAVTLTHIEQGTPAPVVTPGLRAQFQQELTYWRASAIVIGPAARPSLITFMEGLMQRPPIQAGGVLLWRLAAR
jgi:dolichyl-phosphate beta-glucosyltransferase